LKIKSCLSKLRKRHKESKEFDLGETAMEDSDRETKLPKRRFSELMAEHDSLERRMQNDSRIYYGLITSLYGFAVALLSGYVYYLSKTNGDGLTLFRITASLAVVIASIAILALAGMIQDRLNAVGDLRRARAVEIEKEIGIFSFRLFPPWTEVPNGTRVALGEIAQELKLQNQADYERFLQEGERKYKEIMDRTRMSETIRCIRILFWAIFFVVLVVAILDVVFI
jgi:hypothetical protein